MKYKQKMAKRDREGSLLLNRPTMKSYDATLQIYMYIGKITISKVESSKLLYIYSK